MQLRIQLDRLHPWALFGKAGSGAFVPAVAQLRRGLTPAAALHAEARLQTRERGVDNTHPCGDAANTLLARGARP